MHRFLDEFKTLKEIMVQYNLPLEFIPHEVGQTIIAQRTHDGYVNATAMCKAAGKMLNHYMSNNTTKEFLDELSSDTGIPVSGLVIVTKGGSPFEQGTWVHPDVAINLGQWCSAKFAVAVSKWVRDWHSKKRRDADLPYHVRRYVANAQEVPHDHFSMLNELTFNLIGPLEMHGYTLPENLVPDISEGKMFSNWLRKYKKLKPEDFPTYLHRYEDGRVVEARLYPIELLSDFRKHFKEVWMPQRMQDYFRKRDPVAIEYFPKAFPSLYGPKQKRIGRNNQI